MPTKKDPSTTAHRPTLRITLVYAIIAALLLIIANSAFWFNRYIFNTSNFTSTTTTAVLSDSSRNAIAGEIVDQAFKNRPLVQNAVQQPATKLISGLLDSNLAHTLFERSVTRLQVAMTSKDPKPIALDLSSLKATITKVLGVAEAITGDDVTANAKFDPNTIPTTIVLLDTSKLPNIYVLGTVLLWVGPIALLGAIILLVVPLHQSRRHLGALSNLLFIQAGVVFGGWLLALLIGPLFKPAVLAQVPDANLRIVVENVYAAFVATFNNQSASLLVLAVVLALSGGGLWYYRYYRKTHA